MKRAINKRMGMTLTLIAFLAAATGLPGGVSAAESREAQLAAKLYSDMGKIAAAAERYRNKHAIAPSNTDDLLKGGFLKVLPAMGEELGRGKYAIDTRYADMDGQGEEDAVIFSGEEIPAAVCAEYNKRYAEPPLNDGTIFDWRSAGNKYPGAVFGRQMKTYAIKWESDRDVCEVNWVLEYK